MPKMHETVTVERVLAAAEEQMFGMEDAGFCLACGEDAYNVEPDARNYTCDSCGEARVYGAQEVMLMLVA